MVFQHIFINSWEIHGIFTLSTGFVGLCPSTGLGFRFAALAHPRHHGSTVVKSLNFSSMDFSATSLSCKRSAFRSRRNSANHQGFHAFPAKRDFSRFCSVKNLIQTSKNHQKQFNNQQSEISEMDKFHL